MSDLVPDLVESPSPGNLLAQAVAAGLAEASKAANHPLSEHEVAAAVLEHADAFQALDPQEQARALEQLTRAGWQGLEPNQICSAVCVLALGDGLALLEQGPLDLKQAALAALDRRTAFSALGPDAQANVLGALVSSGFTDAIGEPNRFMLDRVLARCAQCCGLALGDPLVPAEHMPLDLQRTAFAAIGHCGAFVALKADVQAHVTSALVSGGLAYVEGEPRRHDLDRAQAYWIQCWSVALGDVLSLPERGALDLKQAAHNAVHLHNTFCALGPGAQSDVLLALACSGQHISQIESGRHGAESGLARYVQCWSLALGDELALPEQGPVDLVQAAQAALNRRVVFNSLRMGGQATVLRALVDGGVTHLEREPGRSGQDRELARYVQCWSLALGESLALPEQGPVDLAQVGLIAMEQRRVFARLDPYSQEQVLKALFYSGNTHATVELRQPAQEIALARWLQCWCLAVGDALALPEHGPVDFKHAALAAVSCHKVFSALTQDGQALALNAIVNAGKNHGEPEPGRPGQDRELARYLQCWSLALGDDLAVPEHGPVDLQQAAQRSLDRREVFTALGQDAQTLVLKALLNGGAIHGHLEPGRAGQDRELARYLQCWSLALGDALALPEHGPVDLQQVAQATLDLRRVFRALSPNAQAQTLVALVDSGAIHGRRESGLPGRPGQDRALARYLQCWSLALGDSLVPPTSDPGGIQVAVWLAANYHAEFGTLVPAAKSAVLRALFNAAGIHGSDPGKLNRNLALIRWLQCLSLALGDPIGLSEQHPIELQPMALLVQHRVEALRALGSDAHRTLLDALYNAQVRSRSGTDKQVLWAMLVALLPRTQEGVSISRDHVLRSTSSARYSANSHAAASTWLLRLSALPAMPAHPDQVVSAVHLASQLLALERRENQPLRQWLQELAHGGGKSDLSRLVFQRRGWPLQFTELPHWLMALGLAGSGCAIPSRELASAWTLDVAALARQCGWLRCLDADGNARMSHILRSPSSPATGIFPFDATRWQLDESEHPRWTRWLIALSKGETLDDIELAFAAWWQQARQIVEDMFTWRRRWLPDEPAEAAWQASAQAALLAQADRFVQQVWQMVSAGLPTEPQAVALGSPDAAPSSTPTNLHLSWLNQAHVGKTDRLLQAQQYWAAQLLPQTEDAAQLWRLLELSRHSLLPAKPGSAQWRDWDKPALDALKAAEQRALNDAQARLDAQAQGRPEPPNCLNADRPIEPFATMAQQWDRMGVGLDVPTAPAIAQCLGAHEALAQPWWDPDGQGHLLLLQPGQALQRMRMPAHLGAVHWQGLAWQWQHAAQLDGDEDTDDSLRNEPFAQAWGAMADPQGVAVATWHWLREQAGGACTNLIIVWPADKAAWPWQALVETLEPEDGGVTLELAAGGTALMKSRMASASALDQGRAQATTHAALFSDDLWGSVHPVQMLASRLEASVLPQVLRTGVQRSADAARYVKALQSNGLVHLATHGVYDEGQPLASYLVLHDAQAAQAEAQLPDLARRRARRRFVPTEVAADAQTATQTQGEMRHRLPAWLLAEMSLVQPEVSLSACQALRTGQGDDEAALRGPAGLGAVLSAAGARSVVGNLWICESLGIVLFYERWFAHRQQHDALRALRLARRDMRAMTWEGYAHWLEQWLQQAQHDALLTAAQREQQLQTAREELQKRQAESNYTGRVNGPFDHPIDWCGMCLIGNAPARPDEAQRAAAQAAKTSWLQRWLQRRGLAPRAH